MDILSVTGNIILAVFSLFLALILTQTALKYPKFRSGWILVALGVLIWCFIDLSWVLDILYYKRDPRKSVTLMYLKTIPNVCFLLAVFSVATHDRRNWLSFQFLIDSVAICTSIIGFVYFAFFYNKFLGLFQWDHQSISAFLYLILDMLIITFSASIYASLSQRKIPLYLTCIAAGIVLFAINDTVSVNMVFNNFAMSNVGTFILTLISLILLTIGNILFNIKPAGAFDVRKDHSSSGIIYRSFILLCIPIIASAIREIHAEEIFFFVVILIIHQIISLIIRRLIQRELEIEEKTKQSEILEATIADRTRDLRIMNQTLENLLKRDAITGLFNRKYFMEYIEEAIQTSGKDDKIWMLILDLDRFKTVNDTYGHDVGDRALRLVSKRLSIVSNDRTLLARLGGDEFGIVCQRRSDESITELLHTISDMSETAIQVDQFTVHISLSIGIACWPDDAPTRSDLMRHADIAMYIAKSERINGVSFFEKTVNAGVERNHQIDIALKKAKISEEFELVYQGQFAIGGRRLVGMEALVRWISPDLGPVTPDEFIPVAEDNGVIIPLSDWIMHQAFAQIAEWNNRYKTNYLVGINISPHQLDDLTFMLKLEAALDDFHVRPEWVNLEITERSAMKGENFIIQIFNRLSGLNITSSIDDFGTGYSSLSYLKKFNIDYLKIAKQLIDGIATNDTDAQIVQAIIMMATAMNLRTIAEGVEDESQFRILEALGCDEIQGYYLGKPQNPAEFEELFLKS